MTDATDQPTIRHPRHRRRGFLALLATALVPAALAVSALLPATASAATAPAAAPAQNNQVHAAMFSKGFTFWNNSRYQLRLDKLSGDGNYEGRPDLGSILKPGTTADFEVQYRIFSDQNDDVTYQVLNDAGQPIGIWHARISLLGDSNETQISGTDSTYGVAKGGGQTLALEDPPNTVIDVPGSDPQNATAFQQQLDAQARARVLALCGTNATCSLKLVGGEQKVLAPGETAGTAVENIGDGIATHTVSGSLTVSSGDSVDSGAVDSKNLLQNLIEGQISTTDHHQWASQSEKYEESLSVEIPGNHKSYLTYRAPLLRDTGNFTITLANTTWHIDGVTFDTPNPDHKWGEWDVWTVPLSGGTPTLVSRS